MNENDPDYHKVTEAEANALKKGWVAARKQNHLCWCDTCYSAYVRARIGMA